MSAEDAWNAWERLLEPRDDDDSEAEGLEIELRRAEADLELDETVTYENEDNEDNMAAAQVDIAALLAQLTQSNIDEAQREIDRDARLVNAAQARGQEDIIRAQVQKIDKCQGDDKPSLRRWIRDLTTLHAAHADAVVTVAERTSRENLADTVEAFLADPANASRAGIAWPALRANIEGLLLGAAYEEVLRCEHRTLRQKAHEDTTAYSERYLNSAKSAYPEPWGAITNQQLIAQFAEGLEDKRMARDVGVVLRIY